MAAVRKYLFDNDFERPDANRARRPAFTEADLEAAKREAFEEGRSQAARELLEAEERRIAEALDTVRARIDALVAERRSDLESLSRESASIAVAICRKVLPTLASQNALGEIEGLIVRCLADLRDEPRVVVRVADSRVEALHARVERMTAAYDGKMVLLGDDEMNETDCAVLWADGGTERNLARLWADIEGVVSRVTDAGSAPELRSPLDDLPTVGAGEGARAPADASADIPTTDTANQECGHGRN